MTVWTIEKTDKSKTKNLRLSVQVMKLLLFKNDRLQVDRINKHLTHFDSAYFIFIQQFY